MARLLGLDISTTAAKALLIDRDGRVVAAESTAYAFAMPRPLWVEQNPRDWWSASVASIRGVLARSGTAAREIAAVGLTGQMHGLVLLDGRGGVIRPCILWNDQRSASQCAEITRRLGAKRVMALTGNPVLPGFTAPKLLWVRDQEPDAHRRIAQVLLPKDYVRYQLTGVYRSEVSDASGTALFDVRNRRWSDEMRHALDIPRGWLPEVTESPVVSAAVDREAAAVTGLVAGTPVVGGAGDQAAGAVGVGAVVEGIVAVTLGTSGVVFATTPDYRPERRGRLHTFCHAAPGTWHVMGVMLSAGGSLHWLKDLLRVQGRDAEEAYHCLTEEASSVPAGSEGLLFLPYLSGERTPHADAEARGAFVGLTIRHGKPHLVRAVLEGVAFGLRDSLGLVSSLGAATRELRLSGGGARDALWRQIVSDVLGAELALVHPPEGAALGAALLAGVGAGVFPSVEEASRRAVHVVERVAPDPANKERYDRLYDVYRSLYPALRSHFHDLGTSLLRTA